MADPRFFANAGPFPIGELARRCGAELGGGADAAKRITDVAPLDTAGPDHISFLDNRKYVGVFVGSRAGACVVHPAMAPRAPAGMALLIAPDPYRSYAMGPGPSIRRRRPTRGFRRARRSIRMRRWAMGAASNRER